MEANIQDRRQYSRYQIEKSPIIFCSTLIGKVTDIGMGGVQMVHTGMPARFLGDLCKISIMGKDFAMEFQTRLIGATRVNKLMNLCRFKFVALTEEKQSQLSQFIARNTLNTSPPD